MTKCQKIYAVQSVDWNKLIFTNRANCTQNALIISVHFDYLQKLFQPFFHTLSFGNMFFDILSFGKLFFDTSSFGKSSFDTLSFSKSFFDTSSLGKSFFDNSSFGKSFFDTSSLGKSYLTLRLSTNCFLTLRLSANQPPTKMTIDRSVQMTSNVKEEVLMKSILAKLFWNKIFCYFFANLNKRWQNSCLKLLNLRHEQMFATADLTMSLVGAFQLIKTYKFANVNFVFLS